MQKPSQSSGRLDWEGFNLIEHNGSITLSKKLVSNSYFVLSMPPEGVGLRDYLTHGEAWHNVSNYEDGSITEKCRRCRISVPPMTLSSEGINPARTMKDLGIASIFEADADFSDLTPHPLIVDGIPQRTKQTIDERGLKGSSYVLVAACAGLPTDKPEEPQEIFFDRPFAIAVLSPNHDPLFVGAYASPE